MPQINRIRVNNIKYNFGTQAYDDFVMKPFCKNTLYDLANGGGKSVLMLLLLQTVIPNSTLDEKQPIEKLFRSSEGSKTIHSLIEWKLDAEDVENGFQYMTTGFCARKAAQTEEEIKDTASIEYFNYCIFYRHYNDNDIRNLPLTKDKERITYSGLRRYLKELEKDPSLKIAVFERKGEYQSYLQNYGIYESAWEIIRGINKTEGHVRTYFEQNYKTTRKVVEDLLIEEILGTSFRRKTGREDTEDVMGKTLLDMKDKLTELAKQKDALKNYDRQEEVLTEFSDRVDYLGSIYTKQEENDANMNRIYYTAERLQQETGQTLEQKKEEIKKAEQSLLAAEAELMCANLSEDRELERTYQKEEEERKEKYSLFREQRIRLTEKLILRESGNDYLAYLEEKKKRDEMAVTLKAVSGQSDLQREISALVLSFRDRKTAVEEELSEELAQSEKAVLSAELRLKTAEKAKKDIEKELAVADILYEQGKKELSHFYSLQKDQKAEVGLLLNEEVPGRLYTNEQKRKRLEAEKETLQKDNEEAAKKQEELSERLLILREKKIRQNSSDSLEKAEEEKLAAEKEQADKLAEAYGEKDYRQLSLVVLNRYAETSHEIKKRQEEMRTAKKRVEQLRNGELFASSEAANLVCDYMQTRYRQKVQTGAAFLAEKSKEEQTALLAAYPGLLSAVITSDFSEAASDRSLPECIPEGEIVLLLRPETLRGGKEPFLKEKMMLLVKDAAGLLTEKSLEKEILRQERIEEEAQNAITKLSLLLKTYEEDAQFLALFNSRFYSRFFGKKNDYAAKEPQELYSEETERELLRELSEVKRRLKEFPERISEIAAQSANAETETEKYRAILLLIKQAEDKEKALKELADKQRRLSDWEKQAVDEIEKAENERSIKRAVLEKQKSKWIKLRQTFESYEIYLTDGEPASFHGTLSELMVEIDGKIAALHMEASSIEDKHRLMDSYVLAMNRLLRSIQTRGVSLSLLSERYEQNEIFETSEEELTALREEIKEVSKKEEELQKRLSELTEKRFRLEGKNEQAKAAIVEKYGAFSEILLTGEALLQYKKKQKLLTEQRKEEQQELQREEEKLRSSLQEYQNIRKEIEQLYEGTGFLQSQAEGEADAGKLSIVYKEARERYLNLDREIEKRREEFYRNRQTTMETLQVLDAQALAEEIGQSIHMPGSRKETDEMIHGLSEVRECLQLEKTRIEAGLVDLLTIKENFESQCLQRCLNIRADLERLPKLSRIVLDGEQIPMISLQIPYIREELFEERMSEYIDRVVKEVDTIKTQQDRAKYIRTALSYKKLFSVIVTDMNAIRLHLYKRERIREQSRMLPYEDAVGSTGQSQGIYIQFLIAVINYISSIYSPKGEAAGLLKVIFIDNPFGAAKDVYIWEPIFELLRANRVQLIVPARGVTPAITGRFDVNYVLGQKLIDGRQQTVVVDYSSNVESEAIEYLPLQFEQTSLDITEV